MNWIRQREQVEEGTEYQKPKFGETPRLMGRFVQAGHFKSGVFSDGVCSLKLDQLASRLLITV